MASRPVDSASAGGSVTEEDLQEASRRLLDHMEDPAAGDYEEESLRESFRESLPEPLPATGHVPHYSVNPTPTTLPNAPMPATRQWPTTYGSMPIPVAPHPSHRKPISSKRYRLPLLILLFFDWGLVIFFSIVVMENGDYFGLEIHSRYFDLVIISTIRVILNVSFYLVLGWVTRLIMGVTTILPALYLPVKAYYAWNAVGDEVTLKSIATLMMLIVTFGMPWITAFFFEFKFLPAELARLNIPTWRKLDVWLWPQKYVRREGEDIPSLQNVAERPPMPNRSRPRLTASNLSLDFRTPVGSSRASPIPYDRHGDDELPPISEEFTTSMDHHSPECDQTMSAEDLRFKREALNAIEAFKAMTNSNEGWTEAKVERDLIIYSKTIEGKKVWKAEGMIYTSAIKLFNILYPGDCTPEWSRQCGFNQTVYRVDDATDVIYTISNAVGPVSSRDFVSVRQKEVSEGKFYAASKSIVTALKPEQPGKVRAENGPCGYLVIPVNASQCKFVWVLNSNLKGWMPQTVIDQSLTAVLTSSIESLRTYAAARSPPDQ